MQEKMGLGKIFKGQTKSLTRFDMLYKSKEIYNARKEMAIKE